MSWEEDNTGLWEEMRKEKEYQKNVNRLKFQNMIKGKKIFEKQKLDHYFPHVKIDMDQEYKCSSGHTLKILTVKKDGDNKGREFLASDDCGAFHWLDNYQGNPPKCKQKKDFTPKRKSPEPQTKAPTVVYKKPPLSPHSQVAVHLDLTTMATHKAKDLVDLADQFEDAEDMMAWYFGIAKTMNEYFLSKVHDKRKLGE